MSCIYMVTLDSDATDQQVQAAKDQAIKNGGTIIDTFALIKGFSVELPAIHTATITTLSTLPKVKAVEKDQIVTANIDPY